MTLNHDSVGTPFAPLTKDYTWKDVVLYALGVGAGFSDLNYCYEKDLKVIPSFSIASIFDILMQIGLESKVNLAGVLHGEQELIFHNPIPVGGTMTTNGKITHMYDKGEGRGALIVGESDTFHSNGQKLFTSICTLFGRLDGGFGGEDAPKSDVVFPDRDPDFTINETPTADQPLIYRLSGDVFSLHVDPEFAKMSGFEKPIMHGLCTHGFACRSLIDSLIPGKPEKARRMVCRFTKTLYPGVPIETLIWKIEDGRALWRVVNTETGETVIDNGIFEYGEIPKREIRYDGRVAIVTGAGAGLGKAYALELARRGAKVVVNDLGGARDGSGDGSAAPADQVVAEIRKAGGEAVANYDNVATANGGENIVKTAVDVFGTVDILINNAGILRDKTFIKMDPENWNAVLDVHLNGAYNVTRPAFAIMKEKGYGRIVMTTSAAGLYGNFGQINYSSAKLGLVGLMNTLKLEGKKYNIKSNTIAPVAASRLTEDILPQDLFEKMKPEFISPMVMYLCSEGCKPTGEIFNAGMGYYNRAAIMTGPGVQLDTEELPTVETICDNFEAIHSMAGAKELGDANAALMDLMTPPSPPETEKAPAPTGGVDIQAIFDNMASTFNPEAAGGVDVVYQFNISGAAGGDWAAVIKNSTCTIKTGQHDEPVCTLKMADADFSAMMSGKLPAMQAFTSGKLMIEGDIMKSQLLEKLFNM